VQAEGSFAFNRIAVWLSLRVQAWLLPSTALFVHAQKSGRRVSTDCCRMVEIWGWKTPFEAAPRRMAFLVCVSFASLVPPTLIFHTTFGCTGTSSGMWAALARFQPMANTKRCIPLGRMFHISSFNLCAPDSLHIESPTTQTPNRQSSDKIHTVLAAGERFKR
jgi:hypothetical protein